MVLADEVGLYTLKTGQKSVINEYSTLYVHNEHKKQTPTNSFCTSLQTLSFAKPVWLNIG